MKFFLDENTSPRVVAPLASIFRHDEFITTQEMNLLGTKDVPLFDALGALEVDAIVTRDRQQLVNPTELQRLHENGLSWIGYKDLKGVGGIDLMAAVTATLASGIAVAKRNWTGEPRCYKLAHIGGEPTQRYTEYEIDTSQWRVRKVSVRPQRGPAS